MILFGQHCWSICLWLKWEWEAYVWLFACHVCVSVLCISVDTFKQQSLLYNNNNTNTLTVHILIRGFLCVLLILLVYMQFCSLGLFCRIFVYIIVLHTHAHSVKVWKVGFLFICCYSSKHINFLNASCTWLSSIANVAHGYKVLIKEIWST